MTDNPKELIEVLNECDTIQVFEKKIIQAIIDYKWYTYTKSFFLR